MDAIPAFVQFLETHAEAAAWLLVLAVVQLWQLQREVKKNALIAESIQRDLEFMRRNGATKTDIKGLALDLADVDRRLTRIEAQHPPA